jgi:hypothetical protein
MTSQYLVRVGKWERVTAGYRYAEILPGNTTDRVRQFRKIDREKPSRQRQRQIDDEAANDW